MPLDYAALTSELIDDGGFTVEVDGGHPTQGYVVSTRPDSELAFYLDDHSTRLDVARWIYAFVVQHGYDLREGYRLGGWRDGETLVLDLVQVEPNHANAEILAEIFDQIAIYDLATREVIRLR